MRYRKRDENGDYSFGRGALDFQVNSPEAVAQAIQTRLQLWLGEWFLDVKDGMPWNEKVLGTGTSRLRDAAVRERVLGTTGVKSLLAYQSSLNSGTREFRVALALDTIYGPLNLTGTALLGPSGFSPLSLSVG